jgi:hypothetical protein
MSSFFLGGLPTVGKKPTPDVSEPGNFKAEVQKIVHKKEFEDQARRDKLDSKLSSRMSGMFSKKKTELERQDKRKGI